MKTKSIYRVRSNWSSELVLAKNTPDAVAQYLKVLDARAKADGVKKIPRKDSEPTGVEFVGELSNG